MRHRIAFAAIAGVAAIVGACADQDGGSSGITSPSTARPMLSYTTTGSAAVVNPRTHRLEIVKRGSSLAPGMSASVVGSSSTAAPLVVSTNEPGVAHSGGSSAFSFVDSAYHKHSIVLLYRSTGGPPAAMQHYVDGSLVSTTAYAWGKISGGWIRTNSVMRSVRNGTLVGTYTTTTLPAPPAGGGPVQTVQLQQLQLVSPLQRMVGAAFYGLALASAPQDASAQAGMHFYDCRQEWIRYMTSAFALSAAAVTLASAPEVTPILLSGVVVALGTTAGLEDQLIDCMLSHEEISMTGLGGAGAGAPGDKWDCFEGSYSAHCTTAFTL